MARSSTDLALARGRACALAGVTAATLILAPSCRDDDATPPRTLPGATDAGTKAHAPVTEQAQEAVKKATAHAVRLQRSIAEGSPSRKDYLGLRRWVAASKPHFQLRAQMGSEVLVGPLRSVSEAGGALGALDAALAQRDLEAAAKEVIQVVRALRLIDHELAINEIPPKEAAEAMSDAAYDLGLMVMEAYPGVPDGSDAALADLRGTLVSIRGGSDAILKLAKKSSENRAAHRRLAEKVSAFEARLASVDDSHALKGRATLVRMTGELGVAARLLCEAVEVEVSLPYRARRPVADNSLREPVTAFTVPAPRRDLRKGDRHAMVALGRDLFVDRRLSKDQSRACVDCHQPQKAYTDGRPTPESLPGAEPIARNTPTLLYTSLHAAQLWDGLFASAEDQALKVIHTASEMGLQGDELIARLSAADDVRQRFAEAFPDGLTADNVGRALVAFEIAELVPADSPLDRFARGDDDALTPEQREGLDVFGGVGRCGRCHIPPLFGGSRPPDFSVPVYAALGVLEEPVHEKPSKGAPAPELDDDPGRGRITKSALDAQAFKTPTLRNIHLTAPYMHHGAYATLDQVLDFYDAGGGTGRGAKVPNQDPDVRKLDLTKAQRAALEIFLTEALADPTMPEIRQREK